VRKNIYVRVFAIKRSFKNDKLNFLRFMEDGSFVCVCKSVCSVEGVYRQAAKNNKKKLFFP
jgi:hypothetical protein